MLGRSLEYSVENVQNLGPAALDDLLEHGDLEDWAPLAAAVQKDPFGATASGILKVAGAHPMYGTSALWTAWIKQLRTRKNDPLGLAALRRRKGLTQHDVAVRLGISQSDVSKLERRSDIRISTLRAYITATGGDVSIIAHYPGEDCRRRLGLSVAPNDRTARAREFLETEIWASIPDDMEGKELSKTQKERILGYGRQGV